VQYKVTLTARVRLKNLQKTVLKNPGTLSIKNPRRKSLTTGLARNELVNKIAKELKANICQRMILILLVVLQIQI